MSSQIEWVCQEHERDAEQCLRLAWGDFGQWGGFNNCVFVALPPDGWNVGEAEQ